MLMERRRVGIFLVREELIGTGAYNTLSLNRYGVSPLGGVAGVAVQIDNVANFEA